VTSDTVGRWRDALFALSLIAACERPASSVRSAAHSAESASESADRATPHAAIMPTVGITHEELLRLADAEERDASEPEVEPEGASIPEDRWFADETGVEAQRTRYEMRFADERADRPSVERVLRVDDQGERIVALLYGTGFVIAPGYRLGGRASMSAWALIAADQRSHRALNPDELRQWFFGQPLPRSIPLSFRRSDDGLTATRGPLTLSLQFDATSPTRALSCRLFVSLMLGGDAAAVRTGCEGARVPTRVTLRARGLPVLAFDKTETSTVQLPRNALSVPPREAVGQTLSMPQRGEEGGFFTPNELLALEPVRPANAASTRRRPGWAPTPSQLEVVNATQSEVLLFVDDTAIGWLAAGRTATFAGVRAGRHTLRARSIDGLFRTAPVSLSAPARWEVGATPRSTR